MRAFRGCAVDTEVGGHHDGNDNDDDSDDDGDDDDEFSDCISPLGSRRCGPPTSYQWQHSLIDLSISGDLETVTKRPRIYVTRFVPTIKHVHQIS